MSGTRLNNNVDFSGVLTWSGGGSANANTAYGWGNHASAGYTTGNQTITLSGDVTGSGTTSITTTVANDSHTHSTYLPLAGGTMTGNLVIDKANATFSLGERASRDTTARSILLEGSATDPYGEASG